MRLLVFIEKKFVTMHGHMKVKCSVLSLKLELIPTEREPEFRRIMLSLVTIDETGSADSSETFVRNTLKGITSLKTIM